MIWVYPPPSHPRRQKLWQITHWRRHRRFMRYLDQRITEFLGESSPKPKGAE